MIKSRFIMGALFMGTMGLAGFAYATPKPEIPVKADLKNGQKSYLKNCASCHGKTGKGDTSAGKMMGARDLTQGKFKFGDSDKALIKTITKGNGKMPPIKTLSDKEVDDLIAYIRTLQVKK